MPKDDFCWDTEVRDMAEALTLDAIKSGDTRTAREFAMAFSSAAFAGAMRACAKDVVGVAMDVLHVAVKGTD